MAKPQTVLFKVAFTSDVPIGKILLQPRRPTSMRVVGGRGAEGLFIWNEYTYGRQVVRTNPVLVSTQYKLTPDELKEMDKVPDEEPSTP